MQCTTNSKIKIIKEKRKGNSKIKSISKIVWIIKFIIIKFLIIIFPEFY